MRETDPTGRNLERYTARLYESLGYAVETDVVYLGQQIDILATKFVEGIGTIRLLIECKHKASGNVSNGEVQACSATFQTLREKLDLTAAVMVTDADYTGRAKGTQPQPNVQLFTLSQLENSLLQLRDAYIRQRLEYESSPIYTTYVPQPGLLESGTRRTGGAVFVQRRIDDAVSEIETLIDTQEPFFMTVLADYGSGKTTLLERIRYRYAKRFLEGTSHLKPLLIRLREFPRFGSARGLLADTTRTELGRDLPFSIFERTAREGGFLLLLDGFDEMATRADAATRVANLRVLASLLGAGSTALLTCRPAYFVSDAEYGSAMSQLTLDAQSLTEGFASPGSRSSGNVGQKFKQALNRLSRGRIADDPERSLAKTPTYVLRLREFGDKEIDRYLAGFEKVFQELFQCSWTDVRTFLLGIYDLSDLMSRPILLAMVVDTIRNGDLDPRASTALVRMGPSTLYDLYTDMQLQIEWGKGATRRLLTSVQRRDFAQAVAVTMFDEGNLEVSYEKILATVKAAPKIWKDVRDQLGNATAENVATDVQMCSFLRRDGENTFRFSHKSFYEYFVAQYLRQRIVAGRSDARLRQKLPREIVYFLGGFGVSEPHVRDALIQRERAAAERSEASELRENLLRAVMYSGPEQENLNIDDCVVSDVKLSRVGFYGGRWRRSCLSGVELRSVKFRNLRWHQMRWTDCQTTECSFDKCVGELSLDSCRVHESVWQRCEIDLSGKRTMVWGGCIEGSRIVVAGDLVFKGVRWTGGLLEYRDAAGTRDVVWDDCEFTDVSLGLGWRSLVSISAFERCSFKSCAVVGIKATREQLDKGQLSDCEGLVVIEGDTRDHNRRARDLWWQGKLCCIAGALWRDGRGASTQVVEEALRQASDKMRLALGAVQQLPSKSPK